MSTFVHLLSANVSYGKNIRIPNTHRTVILLQNTLFQNLKKQIPEVQIFICLFLVEEILMNSQCRSLHISMAERLKIKCICQAIFMLLRSHLCRHSAYNE